MESTGQHWDHLLAQHQYQHASHSDDMTVASFPTLERMSTGARAGGFLPYIPPMPSFEAADTSREAPAVHQFPDLFAPIQNSQAEADFPRTDRSPRTELDAFRGYGDTSQVHIDPGGGFHEGYERVQHNPELGLNDVIILKDQVASRHEHQEDSVDTCVGNGGQPEVLTFPEGEAFEHVTITANDLEGLEPMRFLSDNIIDFYIKYLEGTLSLEERERFHFFNSFFCTKLMGNNSAAADIDDCEVDYNELRKWTGKADLFKKDYVFIPIIRSSHWSLIVICHLSGLTSSSDERKGSPCVVHLDPREGTHESFERQVRSFIIQAWMERNRDSLSNSDRIIYTLACRMKYLRAKVPQQRNDYDCGLFLLHYVESFIHESGSPEFSFASSRGGPHFTSPHFEQEISDKRMVIYRLICELCKTTQERAARVRNIQPSIPQPFRASVVPKPKPKPRRGERKIALKFSDEETLVLLKLLEDEGRIRKGSGGFTHWQLASNEILALCGTVRSEEECRRRYDTLKKAHKKIKDTGKPFSDITDEERGKLSLATPLSEEWYNIIDRIQLRSGNAKSRKRAKVNQCDGNGMLLPSPHNPLSPPPCPAGPSEPEEPSRKRVAIPGFSDLDEDVRSALLNLIQALSMKIGKFSRLPGIFKLEQVCQWLAVVQDRKPSDIRQLLYELSWRKLVDFGIDETGRCEWLTSLDLPKLRAYKKFSKKVLRNYSEFDIYLQVCGNYGSVSFPKVPLSFDTLQRIRVLSLHKCEEVKRADLSKLPELRSLSIEKCGQLEEVIGWEVLKDLGWLRIHDCDFYVAFPCVNFLPSLRKFHYSARNSSALGIASVPDFRQCVWLRELAIKVPSFFAVNSMDLSTLRFLEVLKLQFCASLTTIEGLSGLHSLRKLVLLDCKALRGVPELGCLKALTRLDLWGSGVKEIAGVRELHLLTHLDLTCCYSLKTVPWLGHLKALVRLNLGWSGVEEIPGVQELVSLERLSCRGSRLKSLPDLHHLRRLQCVDVGDTPLSTTDPSSCYYGKGFIEYNSEEGRQGFGNIEISDVSDTEDNASQ